MMTDEMNAKSSAGRPKGAHSKTKTEKLLARLANSRGDNLSKIVNGVMALAEGGEKWAAEAVMDRMWPKPKGRPVKIDLPVGLGIAGIAAAMDRIIAAVNAGTISPDEGLTCAALLEKQAAMLEARDVERRLAALEAAFLERDRADPEHRRLISRRCKSSAIRQGGLACRYRRPHEHAAVQQERSSRPPGSPARARW
jgi:hypothetical protein